MKLSGTEDDDRFREIEHGGHRRSTTPEQDIGGITRRQGAHRSHERDQKPKELETGGVEVYLIELLHVPGEPLIDGLPHCTSARVSAGGNPHHAICRDSSDDFAQLSLHTLSS